jgi:transposase
VAGLAEHCRHTRYVWNLAVEQQPHWQPRHRARVDNEQCAQLTAARAEHDWLAAGSQTVQQQALRDFAQAMRNFFGGTHRRPTWRKAGVHEGFRQVAVKPHHIEQLNGRFGRVWVPKIGWVSFRRTAPVPDGVKSHRVTRDRAGRWHIAFAHTAAPIPGNGDGSMVGIDLSRSGWGLLATRLQHKAYGRVEQIPAANTWQRCSVCGHVAPGNRKSQAVFECDACTTGRGNADVNAARNIAAGRAVTARADLGISRSTNREPQLCSPAT